MRLTSLLPDSLALLAILSAFASHRVAADTYDMVKEYSGSNFFNDWVFYNNFDNLTNGDVIFVSASQAASSRLAFVDSSTNHAIIKVDNTSTVVFNNKRNTVRIQTSERYSVGSVWTADMMHVPFGCSVWPAWWSNAPAWPIGGEIDTFEGVNLMTNNQMGLHTLPGCTQVGQTQSSQLINSTDCSHLDNNNQGCITTDPSPASFGAGFAAAGGGVFVTEYAATGISIWFFPRANVPSVLSSNSSTIDTSTLGVPVGNWPTTACDSNTFFEAQNLIFDITLCGDFAAAPSIFPQTCSGVCYNDYVLGNGSNYATAFFEIASVRVFSKAGTNTIVGGTTSSGTGNNGTGSTGGGGNGSAGGSASAAFSVSVAGLVGLVGTFWWMMV
ncbi:concanavalin A-like lectin/glucanase domain-containing protein [Crassisporium funariophilum]|nr:concanavalin A-like lectin/glucanase domain-containing protein [Crassisporium funariophilum]